MDWVSIAILIFLGFYTLSGLRQGLVRQALGLVGVILALILAFRHFETVGARLLEYLPLPLAVANIIGFCLIVVGVVALINLIGYVWNSISRATPISFLDSLGGAAFGLLKGAVIVGIILMILMAIPVSGIRDTLTASPVARYLLDMAPIVYQRVERALPASVPRLLVTSEGIGFRRVDFAALEGAKCIACGGKVKFEGFVQKGFISAPKFVCSRCGRTSDGCQTYEGFHLIYGECPVEKSRQGYRLDCKVWPNGKFVTASGPCPVCGVQLR